LALAGLVIRVIFWR